MLWPASVLSFVTVLAGDLVTKALVTRELRGGRVVELPLGGRFEHGENSGVAFGLLAGGELVLIVVLVAVSGLVVLLVRSATAAAAPAAVLLGGALANLIDRAGDGAVTDFIALGPWPPFNLADIAITAGVALLALTLARRPASSSLQPSLGRLPGVEPGRHGGRER